MRPREPLLALGHGAAAHVPQSDILALADLCSVAFKASNAVADGPRLENLVWRLWHRARIAPASARLPSPLPPPDVPILPRPVSSPSLSSSSEGAISIVSTGTSTSAGTSAESDCHMAPGLDNIAGNGPSSQISAGSALNTSAQRPNPPPHGVQPDPLAPASGHQDSRILPAVPAPMQHQQGWDRMRSVILPVSGPTMQEQNSGLPTPGPDVDAVPSVGRLIARLLSEPAVRVATDCPQSVVATPRIVEPSSDSASPLVSTPPPRQPFPTVIVVNPTPHPTPPATPTADTTFGSEYGVSRPMVISGPGMVVDRDWVHRQCDANGQLATPVSLNGDPRGEPSSGPGGFFVDYESCVVETCAAAVTLAQEDSDAVKEIAGPMPVVSALLPAAVIGDMCMPGDGTPSVTASSTSTSTSSSTNTTTPPSASMTASTTTSTNTPASSTPPSVSSTAITTPTTVSPPAYTSASASRRAPSAPAPTSASGPASAPAPASTASPALTTTATPQSTTSPTRTPSALSAALTAALTTPAISSSAVSTAPSARSIPAPTTLPSAPTGVVPSTPIPTPVPAPVSAPDPDKKYPPAEERDKKFFLAALHSRGSIGSGHSSESPESGGGSVGSGSGSGKSVLSREKDGLLAKAMMGRHASYQDKEGEMKGVELNGESRNVNGGGGASPGEGVGVSTKGKGRVVFGVGVNGKRKGGVKKGEVLVDGKGDVKLEGQGKPTTERETKGKGKEKVDGHGGVAQPLIDLGAGAPGARPGLPTTKSLQQLPTHRAHAHAHFNLHNAHGHPSHGMRQLPTNPPPRRQQHSPSHKSVLGAASIETSHTRGSSQTTTSTRSRTSHNVVDASRAPALAPAAGTGAPNAGQMPFHPQLTHLGLHLPTIPPKQRRPIELMETSSEYETTDTEGDDSSWESESIHEEGGGAEGGAVQETNAGPSKHARTASETTSKNKNGKAAATTSKNGTTHRTRDANEFARDAAIEAQRKRDLFQKLPPRSYSNLGQLPRAKSGLSLLFRPDPGLFPEGHPYRTSQSSRDLLARNWSAPAPPLVMAALSKRTVPAGPMQASVNADPVVASVNSRTSTTGVAGGSHDRYSSGLQRGGGGYRPRVKPTDQEEYTDSGTDDPEDAIQLSSSVAQRRLAALMGRRGTQSQQQSRRPSSSHAISPPPAGGAARQMQDIGSPPLLRIPPPVSRTTTAPMLMHPYLPDPAPVQTPHTVRRNIISQELDEELRRNLLWERSQNQIQGRPPRAPGSILPGPWRPLNSTRPEESETQTQTNASDLAPGRRPFGTQRTKSWAGDFHASGW